MHAYYKLYFAEMWNQNSIYGVGRIFNFLGILQSYTGN